MSRTRLLALPLAALVSISAALLPGAASAAPGAPKTAKFTATFTAERTVEWDQQRGVSLIDCMGSHFYEAEGSETWTIKTRKPQKVSIMGGGGMGKGIALWFYGTWDTNRPMDQLGLEAHGVRKRDFRESAGTTGGWCKPGHNVVPQAKGDCGTRLPEYSVRISTIAGALLWSHLTAPHMRRERLGFDKCVLVTPKDMGGDDFPRVAAKLPNARIFNKKQKKITIKGEKTFPAESTVVPNYGVPRTTKATVSWKLVLKRK
jgi:hypothetical protein